MRMRGRAPVAAWWAAGAAVLCALAIVLVDATRAPVAAPIVVYLGGVGTLALAVAVVGGFRAAVGPAVACLVGASALSLVGAGRAARVDAIGVGIACLLAAEFAYRSLERRVTVRDPGGVAWRETIRMAAVVCGAGAGGIALLAVAPSGPSGALVALGSAAAAVGFVVVTLRSARWPEQPPGYPAER